MAQDLKTNANSLLRRLSAADAALLGPLEHVELALRQTLEVANAPNDQTYFIESGLASVVSETLDGDVEIGIIGREGVTGLGFLFGDMQTPFRTFMQIAGTGMMCQTGVLDAAQASSPSLRALLLTYSRVFSIQVATTAAANGRSKLRERLARWLLMVGDRQGVTFLITHDFLAVMLAVRRAGVTEAVQLLVTQGFIEASRGEIHIVDRQGLIGAARGGYGLAESEYERLLGQPSAKVL